MQVSGGCRHTGLCSLPKFTVFPTKKKHSAKVWSGGQGISTVLPAFPRLQERGILRSSEQGMVPESKHSRHIRECLSSFPGRAERPGFKGKLGHFHFGDLPQTSSEPSQYSWLTRCIYRVLGFVLGARDVTMNEIGLLSSLG